MNRVSILESQDPNRRLAERKVVAGLGPRMDEGASWLSSDRTARANPPRRICSPQRCARIFGWVFLTVLWLKAIVTANPISYQLDPMRRALLDAQQLPRMLGIALCRRSAGRPAVGVQSLHRLTPDRKEC